MHSKILHLDSEDSIQIGQLPKEILESLNFEKIWNLHPKEYSKIFLHGKYRYVPRWTQAYGKDYYFAGQTARALDIPSILQIVLHWAQNNIESRLNGLLLNWYDGDLNHYIGKHRDKIKGLIDNTPIVTISLGEQRIFRIKQWKKDKKYDIVMENGTVIVIPSQVNRRWTHEIPKLRRYKGKRISITLRAFE